MGIINDICKDYDIRLCDATDEMVSVLGGNPVLKAGFAVIHQGQKYIFVPKSRSLCQRVHTAAHELAHLLLGHIDSNDPGSLLPLKAKEAEATSFASSFLALYIWDKYSRQTSPCVQEGSKQLTLTVADVAKTLNISKATAYSLMKEKGFPSIRLGRRWIVPVADLERWLSQEVERQSSVPADKGCTQDVRPAYQEEICPLQNKSKSFRKSIDKQRGVYIEYK